MTLVPRSVRMLIGAFLVASTLVSVAIASSYDVALNWFSSRPLSQQTGWDRVDGPSDLMRKAYIMMELANRAYRTKESSRAPQLFGFRELAEIPKQQKVKLTTAGAVGTVVGVSAGGAIEAVTGGTGLATVVLGTIGHRALGDQTITAKAIVSESLDGQVRVVAVEGSQDTPDWILDADASTITDKTEPVTYHHGFFLYASVLLGDVYEKVQDACAPGGPKLWLTGHSMGGAAAQLLAYWLARGGCQVDGVMTFGAPLPGMSNLENRYNQRLGDVTHRFMHEDDPVACLPLGPDWAKLGTKHSFTDTKLHLNDSRDLCTGGGDTLAGQAYAYATKLHAFADPATDLAVWMETTAKGSGLCPESKAGKWLLGIFTAGQGNLACKTIEWGADVAVLKDQLVQLSVFVLDMSNPYKHMPLCGYIDPIAVHGSNMGTFMDPIWAQKMEHTWDLTDCSPPPRRTGPSSEVMKLCKEPRICCGDETLIVTLESGQKVERCIGGCVSERADCLL